MRLEPKNVQLIGSELALQWNDGDESFIEIERLRRACRGRLRGEPAFLVISRPA